MTEVVWTQKALDLLDGLEPDTQERIVKKLDEATDWTSHRLEPLTGYPYYSLRAGDYRAVITWDEGQDSRRRSGRSSTEHLRPTSSTLTPPVRLPPV